MMMIMIHWLENEPNCNFGINKYDVMPIKYKILLKCKISGTLKLRRRITTKYEQ